MEEQSVEEIATRQGTPEDARKLLAEIYLENPKFLDMPHPTRVSFRRILTTKEGREEFKQALTADLQRNYDDMLASANY